ncbi:phosphopyruvate hydratase [Candidatus Micrarchaeota archaeon]|nr:phosphopyruvate hydratase [Candidatus Micrarchaeota archaeon]
MRIERVHGRELLDSRATPTVECEIDLDNGRRVRAIVPSGMSTGSHEARELRDGDRRFLGKGVQKAVKNINTVIAKKIEGKDPRNQGELDAILFKLDGTEDKSNLGSNAILAVSIAFAKAGALAEKKEIFEYIANLEKKPNFNMPVPFANIINGGLHAGTGLKIQEFMIAPTHAKSFSQASRIIVEIYHSLKGSLKKKFGSSAVNVGDEGGFAPPLNTTASALELIQKAIDELGYSKETRIAMDAAASEFYLNGRYVVDGKAFVDGELVDYYMDLIKNFKLVSIEDPFGEDEWESFSELNKKIGSKIQIVGDDLTVTNTKRLKKAIELECGNCLLLKVNQIGSLSESFVACNFAYKHGWNVMVSHRSGETEDPFIADLAVALNCKQIKLGAPARGERTAKYNQLLRIEDRLDGKAKYAWVK